MLVERSNSCGNSPKSLRLEDFVVALLERDGECVHEALEADASVVINLVEAPDWIDALAARSKAFKRAKIHAVVTHGKQGSAEIVLSDGKRQCGMGVFVDFASAKADRIGRVSVLLIEPS